MTDDDDFGSCRLGMTDEGIEVLQADEHIRISTLLLDAVKGKTSEGKHFSPHMDIDGNVLTIHAVNGEVRYLLGEHLSPTAREAFRLGVGDAG